MTLRPHPAQTFHVQRLLLMAVGVCQRLTPGCPFPIRSCLSVRAGWVQREGAEPEVGNEARAPWASWCPLYGVTEALSVQVTLLGSPVSCLISHLQNKLYGVIFWACRGPLLKC